MGNIFRFGAFELRPAQRSLNCEGRPVTIGARALDVLLHLLEHRARLVTKEELLESVWSGRIVEEANVQVQVSGLRKVLGERTISTIPGRGYQFVAAVDVDQWDVAGTISASPWPFEALAILDDAKAKGARTNLPNSLTELIGRDRELEALAELVERNTLVSAVGAPGVGKTLLVQHLLKNARTRYPQGVCWIEFDGVSDPERIVPALITALGIDANDTDQPRGLCAAIADMDLLIGLNNVEHVAAQIAAIAKMVMAGAPRVRLLVTSQVPLGVVGEQVYRVEPLAVPVDELSAALSLKFSAVQLFVQHARSVDPNFALTDDNAPAVVRVCRKLDGLPLAIQLVAARAPVLGLRYLLQTVGDRLRLLDIAGNRGAVPRHRTLRAALEWSHGLLQEQERILFRRLAIFAGSASLESVSRTIALSMNDFDESLLVDSLVALADRSLLILLPSSDASGVRYRLPTAARALGMEHLAQSVEMDLLRTSHAMAMGELAEAAYVARYDGLVPVEEFQARLELDLDNLREAHAWACSTRIATLELQLAVGLLLGLPRSLFAQRIALANRCEELVKADANVMAYLECRAQIAISRVCFNQDSKRSHEASQRAVVAARNCPSHPEYAFLLYNALCNLVRSPRRYLEDDGREAALVEARAIEVSGWPPHRKVLLAQAEAFMAAGRTKAPSSDALNVRVVSLYLASGADASLPLGDLTDVQLAIGNPEAAAQTGRLLVQSLRSTRNTLAQAYAHLNLTAALLAMDDLQSVGQIASEGWMLSLQFDLQSYWADYLTLFCALDGRMHAAAVLSGYADSRYALRDNGRSRNESSARSRACSLIATAIGDTQIREFRQRGGDLLDAEVGRIAFADGDYDAV